VAELKTRPTGASVRAFLTSLDDAKRLDCAVLIKLMRMATGTRPVMWGPSLVGFGHWGDSFLTGFAPRKRDLTIHIMLGFASYAPLLAKLGRHERAQSCLYLRALADVDLGVLRQLVERSVADLRAVYPPAKS
jgi:hypothetical protein